MRRTIFVVLLTLAAAQASANPCHNLRVALAASNARAKYAASWHYLSATQRKADYAKEAHWRGYLTHSIRFWERRAKRHHQDLMYQRTYK